MDSAIAVGNAQEGFLDTGGAGKKPKKKPKKPRIPRKERIFLKQKKLLSTFSFEFRTIWKRINKIS